MANIDVLKNIGTDAFTNYYDVLIPPVAGITGVDGLEYRIQSFPIPEAPRPNTYKVHYKTSTLEKLGSKIDEDKQITFPVRIDRYYQVYDFFRLWKQLGINQVTGVIDEEIIPKVPITVQTTEASSSELTGGLWVFNDAYPLAIEGADFEQEGSDPLVRNIVLLYSVMDDTGRGV